MIRILAAAAFALVASVALASEIDPLCPRVLSPTEAEALAGVKPLTLVGASQVRFATGTCNYATKVHAEHRLVFLVSVTEETKEDDFEQLRSVAIHPRAALGIGDEAFTAEGVVGFRKGKKIVSLGAFPDPKTGRRQVDQSKLLQMAKVVAQRL